MTRVAGVLSETVRRSCGKALRIIILLDVLTPEHRPEPLGSAIRRFCVLLCSWLVLFLAAGGAAQAAESRVALVVGEARYASGPLATPANDAGAVAQSLAAAGFEVTGYADLDRDGLRRAFAGFIDRARQAGPETTVFVYLAGYGLQFDGDNFIAPVEARVARDVDVPAQGLSLGDFARGLAAVPLKARVLVYDLARANRFAPEEPPLARGLAAVEPEAGTLVAFNAAPGAVAEDYPGDYGLYAEALCEVMQTRGLSLATAMTRLRLRVTALSGARTVPWSAGSVDGSVSLLPPVTESTSLFEPLKSLVSPSTPAEAFWTAVKRDALPAYRDFLKPYSGDPLAGRVALLLALRREAAMWMQARRVNVANAYWTYMRFYPRGPHFADARRLLAALPAGLEPPPRFDVYAFADLPGPRPEEVMMLKGAERSLASLPPPPAADLPPKRAEFYDRFPPLLPVAANSLPLAVPVPSGRPTTFGRIVQPGSVENAEMVVAVDVADAGGNLAVVQSARDGRILSTASVTLEPNGSRSLVQTGPDRQALATVTDRTEAGGRRTVVQMGRDKQVISRSVTEVAPDGSRTLTLSGSQGVTAVVATDAAGVPVRSAQVGTPVTPVRAPLIAASRPSSPATPSPPPPPPPRVASTMPLPNLADGAPPKPPEPPPQVVPVTQSGAAVPGFSGTGSPTIALPGRTSAQPLGPPVVPLDPAPLSPPRMASQAPAGQTASGSVPEPQPSAVPPSVPVPPPPASAMLPPASAAPSAAARRDAMPATVAEPLPPRRRLETASTKAPPAADRPGKPPSGAKGQNEPQKAAPPPPKPAGAAKGGKGKAVKKAPAKTAARPAKTTAKTTKAPPPKRDRRR